LVLAVWFGCHDQLRPSENRRTIFALRTPLAGTGVERWQAEVEEELSYGSGIS
jgi:hypothetical protein